DGYGSDRSHRKGCWPSHLIWKVNVRTCRISKETLDDPSRHAHQRRQVQVLPLQRNELHPLLLPMELVQQHPGDDAVECGDAALLVLTIERGAARGPEASLRLVEA